MTYLYTVILNKYLICLSTFSLLTFTISLKAHNGKKILDTVKKYHILPFFSMRCKNFIYRRVKNLFMHGDYEVLCKFYQGRKFLCLT